MGVVQGRRKLMLVQVVQFHTEERKQFRELDAVNRTQTVQLENARDRIGILDLRKPGVRNRKFRISLSFGDFLA
jgi:hypothetical protein